MSRVCTVEHARIQHQIVIDAHVQKDYQEIDAKLLSIHVQHSHVKTVARVPSRYFKHFILFFVSISIERLFPISECLISD